MSAIKQRLFEEQERGERWRLGLAQQSSGDIADYAAALGGEVIDKYKFTVACPGPGCPPDDRSLVVRIYGPNRFFIYDFDKGQYSYAAAKAHIIKRLGFEAEPPKSDNTGRAAEIRDATNPANGTLVETYLRSRAITLPPPPTLRFHRSLKHGQSGGWWPGMVGIVTDVEDQFVAVHRTFLRPDGSGKAPIAPDKMSLGPVGGGAIRLAPLAPKILVGEGIETCLSAMQVTGIPAWSAISAVNMRDKLKLPAEVKEVVILVDRDKTGTGERAARAAASRWIPEGRKVRLAYPPTGKDFNDALMGNGGE
jgi:hypothetical protein